MCIFAIKEKAGNMETKTDKNQQYRTESGLTPLQEQAAILLASGETITAIAEKLEINRSTLYEWQDILTFKCFYNKQCEIIRERIKAGLFGIQDEAFKAIKDILTGDNAAIKLKAAIWLIERAGATGIGETDPHSALKEMVHPSGNFSFWNSYHEKEYLKLLEKFHLQDDDENRAVAPSISDIARGSNQ